MDYAAALAKLKTLEVDGAADLVSAIEGKVSDLEAKNYSVIGEKRTATTKAQSLETALVAIAKAVGLEGDVDAILNDAQTKVAGIVSEAAQLRTDKTALETRATEAEGKVQAAERKGKLSQVAAKAGVNEAVLERLLGDKLGEIAIADDGVKLGDKTLREYVEADEALQPFAPALFLSSEPATKTTPKLPGGSPKGEETGNLFDQAYARATGRTGKTDYSWLNKR